MAKLTKSSGNVFEDLGFDASESENLKLRAQLMRKLEALIHNKHLTQSEAAELLGIHQSRVSDLVRGKIARRVNLRGERDPVGIDAELILCAGAIGTPTLLLRSGIGPQDHLQDLQSTVFSGP